MPSWDRFELQDDQYKSSVLLPGVPVLSVEMSSPMGWERYAHAHVCITGYGHSGPADQLLEAFGFTPKNVEEKARIVMEHYKGGAPPLVGRLIFAQEAAHPSHV